MTGYRCRRLARRASEGSQASRQITPRLRVGLVSIAATFFLVSPNWASAADSAQLLMLFRTGKYAECVEASAKAISESEFNETFRLLKLRSEMELGRYADAAETLDAALKKFSSSIELRWLGRDVVRFNNQPERVTQLEDEIAKLVQQTPW